MNSKASDSIGGDEEAPPVLSPKMQAIQKKLEEVEAARHEMEQAELTARHTAEVWKRKACEFFDMFEQQN